MLNIMQLLNRCLKWVSVVLGISAIDSFPKKNNQEEVDDLTSKVNIRHTGCYRYF